MVKSVFETELNASLQLLRTLQFPAVEVYLFGSHAKGLAHAQSDIDLCIVISDSENEIELQHKAILEFGRAGLNVDALVVKENELRENFTSPILHEIRTFGKKLSFTA